MIGTILTSVPTVPTRLIHFYHIAVQPKWIEERQQPRRWIPCWLWIRSNSHWVADLGLNTISGIEITFHDMYSDNHYLKKNQEVEHWNIFVNTFGKYLKIVKYTPMHLTKVFQNIIRNKYLKILLNSRLFKGNFLKIISNTFNGSRLLIRATLFANETTTYC